MAQVELASENSLDYRDAWDYNEFAGSLEFF
jgi:hypothetical protein